VLFEIRQYHFNPDLFQAYKLWARTEAVPHLAKEIDVLGFWVNTADQPEVRGEPQDSLGSANVTWIVRWRDLAHRNEVLPGVLSSPAWKELFSRVPGGIDSYRRRESKFAESLL
jgi:hypothetical protein